MNDWTTKSDEELAKVLQEDNRNDVNLAMQILHDRYKATLTGYLASKLPPDLIEDVFQETWKGFYVQAMKPESNIEKGIAKFLFGIAHYKMADAYRKRKSEQEIENDIPLDIPSHEPSPEEEIAQAEEEQIKTHLPFIVPLSDCQRVIYALRLLYGYDTKTVARLLSKSTNTISTHLSDVRTRAVKYLKGEEYDLSSTLNEFHVYSRFSKEKGNGFLVHEQFSEPITPKLTAQELKFLGLTPEEYRTYFTASLIICYGFEAVSGSEKTRLFLNLREHHPNKLILTRFDSSPKQIEPGVGYRRPEYLFAIKVDGDEINFAYVSREDKDPRVGGELFRQGIGGRNSEVYGALHGVNKSRFEHLFRSLLLKEMKKSRPKSSFIELQREFFQSIVYFRSDL